jgi:hypothetical protein
MIEEMINYGFIYIVLFLLITRKAVFGSGNLSRLFGIIMWTIAISGAILVISSIALTA